MSKIGNYLIEAEMLGELHYDEGKRRYIKTSNASGGGQHTFAKRPKIRKRPTTASRNEGSDV